MVNKIDSLNVSCANGDGAACLAKQKDELETKLNSIMTKHPENEAEISDVKREIAMLDTEGRYLPAGNLQSALTGADKKPTAEEQASKAESIKKTNEMLGMEIDFNPPQTYDTNITHTTNKEQAKVPEKEGGFISLSKKKATLKKEMDKINDDLNLKSEIFREIRNKENKPNS